MQKESLLIFLLLTQGNSFTLCSSGFFCGKAGAPKFPNIHAFPPSKVIDDCGPTPQEDPVEPETVSLDDFPELIYDVNDVPIAHQPWRRGDTDGCEDPIDASWRLEAEEIMKVTVSGIGSRIKDITWYLGTVVITLEDSNHWQVHGPSGPEVRVEHVSSPIWFDPDDIEPQDDYGIYEGEEDGRIETTDDDGNISTNIPDDPYVEREFDDSAGTYLPPPKRPTRVSTVRNMSREEFDQYEADGMKVRLIDKDDRIAKKKLSMEEFNIKLEEFAAESDLPSTQIEERAVELRARYLRSEDLAEYYPEEFEKVGNEVALDKLAMPNLEREDGIDTFALSVIARALNDALSAPEVEDHLGILSRHEIILTSPGDEEHYVETQRHFDEMRGELVHVQTQDPFGSNRILKGHLVDRNSLDVVLNVKGKMVTIPLNMVAYVGIPRENGSVLRPEYLK